MTIDTASHQTFREKLYSIIFGTDTPAGKLFDLLLIAATDIHGDHGLLAEQGTFPSPRYVDFPLSDDAERHFRRGPPFLMRYLPFWVWILLELLMKLVKV